MDKLKKIKENLLRVYPPFVYTIISVYIIALMIQGNLTSAIQNTNFADFIKHPLPPYRDAIARALGGAAIYFSIIEGETPYSAQIDAPESFIQLSSQEWYVKYFLLERKLIPNCEPQQCSYSIIEAPTVAQATDSAKLYPFRIVKR